MDRTTLVSASPASLISIPISLSKQPPKPQWIGALHVAVPCAKYSIHALFLLLAGIFAAYKIPYEYIEDRFEFKIEYYGIGEYCTAKVRIYQDTEKASYLVEIHRYSGSGACSARLYNQLHKTLDSGVPARANTVVSLLVKIPHIRLPLELAPPSIEELDLGMAHLHRCLNSMDEKSIIDSVQTLCKMLSDDYAYGYMCGSNVLAHTLVELLNPDKNHSLPTRTLAAMAISMMMGHVAKSNELTENSKFAEWRETGIQNMSSHPHFAEWVEIHLSAPGSLETTYLKRFLKLVW